MRKFLLFIACAGFAITASQAQEIRFGVKGGLNLANMSISPDEGEKMDSRMSFHIGGLVEIPVSDVFSVQPEILYSSMGAQSEESYSESFMGMEISGHSETKLKLDYISIPIMAKYYFMEGLAVEAGPQIGFLMNAKLDYSYTETAMGQTMSESGELDVKEMYKGIDFGLGFGASYRMDMGLFFGARYNLGLSNINDISDEDATVKNNVFQISVGYSF